MAFKDADKQLPQTCVHSPTPRIMDPSSQEKHLKRSRFSKSWRYHRGCSRPFLALVSLTLILGVYLMNSAQLCHSANFPKQILKTFMNRIEPLSIHIPCKWSKESNRDIRYHHDEVVFGAPGQSNLKAERRSIEIIKRAVSNGTVPREELQTGPLNTPPVTTSTIPTSSSITTQITSISSATDETTSLVTESSTPTNTIFTAITQTSSSLLPEFSTGSLEITTLTGKSSSNDLSTSSTKIISSPVSTTLARQTIYTTTLPNGGVSTLTSTTIIQTAAEPSSDTDATKTRESPSLQTNIANKLQPLVIGQVIGVFGVAIANAW